ncbi:MAG: pilus assembly protein PilM, partial [Phycisphaerales bacterium]
MASSNVCWGIEIGAAAIKAIKLERDGEGVRVADFAVVPHKRVLTTPDIDTAEAIRLALGAFMAQYRELVRGSRIAVSIPGHMSFARFAQLPPVEPKGVPNVVKFEAVQQIPFPIEEVEWDYQTFAAPDSPDLEVGIFAVTKERVNEQLHLLGDAGLIPDVVTIGPVAAYNAIAYDLSFTEDTPGTVILDIGTQATDLIVADAGRMWIRTFPLGGHAFTEALADAFKLNYVKGEKLKREAETSNYKRHVFQALKPILSDLV